MVIGTCGFVGTGTSAVSDYIKEFSSVSALDMFEFIITHGPDGLEDLDFQLNEHCVKFTSSTVAIERFKSNIYNYLIHQLHSKSMKEKVEIALDKYIQSISQVTWNGYSAIDYALFGTTMYRHPEVNMFGRKAGKKMLQFVYRNKEFDYTGFPLYTNHFSIKPQDFVEFTKQFIYEIFKACNVDMEKNILLDQPFNAINPYRSFKFFDSPKAIIVDRDPCDLYILAKKYLHPRRVALCVPTDTTDNFITYYEELRKAMYENLRKKSDDILFIQFEDLVYQYNETRKKINEFCALDETDHTMHFFDPAMSIANTQLIKRFPEEKENYLLIKERLKDYTYDFEKYGDVDTSGTMFVNRSPLNK